MAQAKIDNFSEQELRDIVANSLSMKEVCQKVGYTSSGSNHKTVQSRLDKYNISTEHFTHQTRQIIIRSPENVFIENSTANQNVLRKWYKKGEYTPYKCAICGLEPFWNGQPLTLTLDHINGHNHDDRLENLRWICPNCDRQLPTFAGKNNRNYNSFPHDDKKSISKKSNYCIDCGKEISLSAIRCPECSHKITRVVERPSKEELYNILIANKGNFTQTSKQFNVTDNAVRKWCKQYNLPFHSKDYKN